MKLSKLAIFLEGGKAVSDVSRVDRKDISTTIDAFKSQVLDKLNVKKFGPIGSVGKKASSGDIDLAVDTPRDFDYKDFHSRLKALGFDVTKASPTTISIKFPIYNQQGKTEEWAQVDLMFGKKDWLEFGYWAPEESESKYSGVHRNILFAAIIRYSREIVGKKDKTWALDFNKGISRKTRGLVQTKTGKEKEKILAKTHITNDPEKVVKLLNIATNGNWEKSDFTKSFEELWKKTKTVFPSEILDKIKNYVKSGIESSKREVPVMENFLNKMSNELFEEEKELTNDAEEMKTLVKKHLKLSDENFRHMSSKKLRLLVPESERYDIRDKLEEIPKFEIDSDMKGSSMGGVRYKNATLLIKPIERQGRKSAGVGNEDAFEKYINEYASEDTPITVFFKASNGIEKIQNVIKAKGVGSQSSKYKKTDIVLEREGLADYNISLKKENAEIWESADTRYKDRINDFIKQVEDGEHSEIYFEQYKDKYGKEKKDVYIMMSNKTGKKVSAVIDKIENEVEVEDLIFGGDEVDSVITATFKKSDFEFNEENKELKIEIKSIISDLSDLNSQKSWPWLRIRHDSTRKTKGLRPVVMMEKSVFNKSGKISGSAIKLK